MPLRTFKLPAPESRLIVHNGVIYKIKLAYKYGKANVFLPCAPGTMQKEVESALRAVLHRDNQLKPMKVKTSHFLIDCEMKLWPAVKKLGFEEDGREVPAYPEMIVLTVQPKPGRRSSAAYRPISLYGVQGQSKQKRVDDCLKVVPEIHSRTSKEIPDKTKRSPSMSKVSAKVRSSTPRRGVNMQDNSPLITSQLSSPTEKRRRRSMGTGDSGKNNDLHEDQADIPEHRYSLCGDEQFPRYDTQSESSTKSEADVESSSDAQSEVSPRSKVRTFSQQKLKSPPVTRSRRDQPKRRRRSPTNDEILEIGSGKPEDRISNTHNLRRKAVRTHHVHTQVETNLSEVSDNDKHEDAPISNEPSRPTTNISQNRSPKGSKNSLYSLRKLQNQGNISDKADTEPRKCCERKGQRSKRSNKSATNSTPKPHTRLRNKAFSRKLRSDSKLSESTASHSSQSDTGPRRSKRLKAIVQRDSPPAKRLRSSRQHLAEAVGGSNNSDVSAVISTGTQTQGSTYRIKNADLKFLKRLAVQQNVPEVAHSGQRPKRVLHTYPSTNEDIGTRSTNREALCYQRDRTLIQQEELAEEMKLQQMALMSSKPMTNKPNTRSSDNAQKKRRSLLMSTIEGLIIPVRKLFT